MKIKNLFLKFIVCLVFISLPWMNGINDVKNTEKITSDLRFYEINTCSIPLFVLIKENPQIIYQDHYKFNFNQYSSLKCVGKVTGIDQIGYTFNISIGVNSIFSILYQLAIFNILILCFISKNKPKINFSPFSIYLTLLLTSLFFTFGIFSEKRFYSYNLYLIDLNVYKDYFLIFLVFFLISISSIYIYLTRYENLINLVPYVLLIVLVFNGTNLYLYSIMLFSIGLLNYFKNFKLIGIKIFIPIILTLFWMSNSNSLFYLDPDKVRGFVNTSWNTNSIFYWSVLTIFIVYGIKSLFHFGIENFTFKKFLFHLLNVGNLTFLFGIIGSHFPILNFLSITTFGQTKATTTAKKLFELNQWGEVLAWRGYYPSAEMMGEVYGLGLLLIYFFYKKNKKINLYTGISTLIFLLNLLLSNNRTSLALLVFMIFYTESKTKFILKNKFNYYMYLSIFILLLGYQINKNSLDYISNKLINNAQNFSIENYSSTLIYLQNSNFIVSLVISLVSIVAFLINRSELWGLFIARYNPSIFEFIFGTSPFGLAKLYSEIKVSDTYPLRGFLLTHSSFILILLFFGFIGLVIFIYIWSRHIYRLFKKGYFEMQLLNIFIFVNLIKSDSILYFSSFLIYLFIFFLSVESIKQNENSSFWK